MAATNQKPEVSSGSPTWITETQTFGPSYAAFFPGQEQGVASGVEYPGLISVFIWETNITDGGFICYVIMLFLTFVVFYHNSYSINIILIVLTLLVLF